MQTRDAVLRVAAVAAGLLVLAAACSSSHPAASSPPTSGPTTSTNPLETPNSIPFDVGEKMGLPNGWIVEIQRVHRPYVTSKLPKPASGRQYVALDVAMENSGTSTETVKAAQLFSLGDSDGKVDNVVAVPGVANRIDGVYKPNTTRFGTLVFNVPAHAQLRMAFNGPLIGTQQTIWMVDPPHIGPGG